MVNHRIELRVLGFLLACLGSATALIADDDFAQRLRAGIEEARAGNFAAAAADLEAATALDPDNPEGWYQLGLLRGATADFPASETAFRRALQLRPDFAPAHYSLGLALIANPRNKLDWPGALDEFRAAIRSKPDYAEAYNLLGAGLANSGDFDAAIEQLLHALQLKASFPEAHFNLALALEKSGRLPEAEREYEATLAGKADFPEAATEFGKLLLRMGKPAEAEQQLRKALALDPDRTDAHYTLARVLQSEKQDKPAEVEFGIAKDLSERPAAALESSLLSNQGLDLAAKGDLAGAEETIRKAIARKPDYGIPHYNMGLILADKGDLAGAAREFVKAISLLPGQGKPWLQLGRVFRLEGKNELALEYFRWAANLTPGDSGVQAEWTSSQKAIKPSGSASGPERTQTVRGFDLHPDISEAHKAFAKQLITENDFLGAAGELLRALALESKCAGARSDLAEVYEKLGDRVHAKFEYQKLALAGPLDADAHTRLGQLYRAEGDPARAVEEFQMALRREPDSARARLGLEESRKELSKH